MCIQALGKLAFSGSEHCGRYQAKVVPYRRTNVARRATRRPYPLDRPILRGYSHQSTILLFHEVLYYSWRGRASCRNRVWCWHAPFRNYLPSAHYPRNEVGTSDSGLAFAGEHPQLLSFAVNMKISGSRTLQVRDYDEYRAVR